MIYCMQCKIAMKVKKTGAVLHFGDGFVTSADLYECRSCDMVNAKLADEGYSVAPDKLENFKKRMAPWFIEMPRE